jgi:hypothetical protein
MHFKLPIKPTANVTKPYNPTSLEVWIGATEIVPATEATPAQTVINLQTETTEILDNGVRIERRFFKYPVEALQPAITGLSLAIGPELNHAAVNQLLADYNLEIVE